ncbi:MAG: DUF1211 domain-containing protein [Bacteroidetes bacterium]|nr:DUF1211 domain-containing protein [Bacteroidota bacterium]
MPQPSNRLEALSDGVIAIILTVMVFDLKINEMTSGSLVWDALNDLYPKLISYSISFFMLSTMWVNHHHLFAQVQQSTNSLLWFTIHLLFWMSLVPFSTNFVGSNPFMWQAASAYGLVFLMCALAFSLLRNYVFGQSLHNGQMTHHSHSRAMGKNVWAMAMYAAGSALAPVSVYVSYALFLLVPLLFIIPHTNSSAKKNNGYRKDT